MPLGRGAATILTTMVAVMMMRVAPHRVAALRRLLRRNRAHAVEAIRHKSGGQC